MNVHLREVDTAFRFEVGQSVDPIHGGMEGFIAERALMEDGSDAYIIWRTYDDDGRFAFAAEDDLVPLERGDKLHEALRAALWREAT